MRLLLLCISLAVAACAGAPATRSTTASAAAGGNPLCVTTASRAPLKDSCPFGRTYSSADIQRTGAATPAQALRLLDPSITVTGH
jgi:hypothetical protein